MVVTPFVCGHEFAVYASVREYQCFGSVPLDDPVASISGEVTEAGTANFRMAGNYSPEAKLDLRLNDSSRDEFVRNGARTVLAPAQAAALR